MTEIPLAVQLACVKREISMRRRVYPRWIALGKMTEEQSAAGLAGMEAVARTLEALIAKENEAVQPGLGI